MNKILLIFLLIIIIVCIIIYYQRDTLNINDITFNKKPLLKKKKKVSFSNNIDYKIIPEENDELDSIINNTKFFTSDALHQQGHSTSKKNNLINDKIRNNYSIQIEKRIDDDMPSKSGSLYNEIETIYPSNIEWEDEEWDDNFGKPLIEKEERQKLVKKMQQDYQNYEKSFDKFLKHQTDNDILMQQEILPDPFKHPEKYLGMTIAEIYDQQVAGPKIIPKKIKGISDEGIEYENELVMNGGKIEGTNLIGFDGTFNKFKSANFTNEF